MPIVLKNNVSKNDLRLVTSSFRVVNGQIFKTKADYQSLVNKYNVIQIAANRPLWLSGRERRI